ncbi:MAG: hypothetical protein ACOVQK_11075 [Cyanobium sp.]
MTAPAPAPSPVPRLVPSLAGTAIGTMRRRSLFLLAAALAAGLALAEDRIWIQEFLTKATAG